MARNFDEIEDVVAKVKAGQYHWHQNGSGFCITSFSTNKRGKVIMQGRYIFGDLEDTMAMSDQIDEWGRAHGAVEFVMDGRLGWQRILKNYGWSTVGVIMSKEL
ncbi:hypothetical protein FF100_22000 [Methylobacterium terricola]|uniref:Uncharacterized protein n=1 Tax=Methylobacterium terricola TaxID=2583531 RepID=A0A5C4LE51_9HYPH|nr:hypothetical protein [Methylobacterium terricola]TNC10826.1 hypothetical protein FF100_22000 [Methylobacterium terricola]